MIQILKYHKNVLNSSQNWSYFFSKNSKQIRHIRHNMAIGFIKVYLTDHLGTP